MLSPLLQQLLQSGGFAQLLQQGGLQPQAAKPQPPPGTFPPGMGQFGQLPQQASSGFGDRVMPYIGQMMLQRGFGQLSQPNYGVRTYAPSGAGGLGLEYGGAPQVPAGPTVPSAGSFGGRVRWANG